MSPMASFPSYLLCINNRYSAGETQIKCLFGLIVSNGGWEKSMVCGKKLDFLRLANFTIHGPIGQMN